MISTMAASDIFTVKGKDLQYLLVYDDYDSTYYTVKCFNNRKLMIGSAYRTYKPALRKFEKLANAVSDH